MTQRKLDAESLPNQAIEAPAAHEVAAINWM